MTHAPLSVHVVSASAAVILAVAMASPVRADLSKLNPTARIAWQQQAAAQASPTAEKFPGMLAITPAGELDCFILGSASRAELEAAGAHVRTSLPGMCTARIPMDALEAVTDLPGVTRVDGAMRLEPELDASVPATGASILRGPGPQFTGLNGAGVLVGDVDTGVDYHHADFKDSTGHTRLVGLWDQTDPGGPPPTGFAYGSDWTPASIDQGTAREQDLEGHGTHVMGIMGGDGSGEGGTTPPYTYAGMAPRASLVMVKSDLSNTGVLDGVNYVFQRAAALGMNAVCNLSIGTQYGPHDGTSPLEAGLTSLVGQGRLLCISAGNDAGIAKHAEVFGTTTGANAVLYVQNAVGYASITVTGYYDAADQIDIFVKPPSSDPVGPFTLGGHTAAYPGVETFNGNVYVENGLTTYPSGAREIYVVMNQLHGTSMNGEWIFNVKSHGVGPANGRVDFWRFNNTAAALFYTGAQSDRLLLTEPGNAEGAITVGAWSTKINWTDCQGLLEGFNPPFGAIGALADFSSPGPTRDGRNKPDLAAPGVEIASTTSFDTNPQCAPAYAWNLDDGMMHTINQGTSMSSPHVAGACALLMQKFGAKDPAWMKQYLFSHARRDSNTGPTWNKDWGWGKLDLGDLTAPIARVLWPNGGEAWLAGDSAVVGWDATDAGTGVTSVDLLLSSTGVAGPFTMLATGLPNTGTRKVHVPSSVTADARVKVVAHDGNNNQAEDVSDGAFTINATTAVPTPRLGAAFALTKVAPNPVVKDPLRVEFTVPRAADVRLLVVDVRGRIVATLARGPYAPGVYAATWTRDTASGRVGPGLYFVHYITPDGNRTQRVIVTD